MNHHQHMLQAEAVWGKDYETFDKVIQDLETGVEVGVAFGGHIEAILNKTAVKKMYGVDPYLEGTTGQTLGLSQPEMDTLYSFVLNRLTSYEDRFKLIRCSSVDAATSIPDVDFVYIDADHSYKEVMADLCAWFPKVHEGGIIGGHDYNHPGLPDVKRAVDRFFRRFGQVVKSQGYVWWIEKKTPRVSFIIPAYNCDRFIREAVESVYDGNFCLGDELIIVDDGSTDNTVSTIQGLGRPIKLLKHSENQGASAARNTAIASAKNPLLFNLDSDNILVPSSIPKLRAYLVSSDSDAAAFREVRFFRNRTGKVTHSRIHELGFVTLADCLAGQITPGASGNYLFTLESWEKAIGYPESARTYETWGFAFQQLATGSKMIVMPDSFYLHRYGHASLWVREGGAQNASLKVLEFIKPFLDLLVPEDVEYIMAHRDSWFADLDQHPIRVKGLPPGKAGIKVMAT